MVTQRRNDRRPRTNRCTGGRGEVVTSGSITGAAPVIGIVRGNNPGTAERLVG